MVWLASTTAGPSAQTKALGSSHLGCIFLCWLSGRLSFIPWKWDNVHPRLTSLLLVPQWKNFPVLVFPVLDHATNGIDLNYWSTSDLSPSFSWNHRVRKAWWWGSIFLNCMVEMVWVVHPRKAWWCFWRKGKDVGQQIHSDPIQDPAYCQVHNRHLIKSHVCFPLDPTISFSVTIQHTECPRVSSFQFEFSPKSLAPKVLQCWFLEWPLWPGFHFLVLSSMFPLFRF